MNTINESRSAAETSERAWSREKTVPCACTGCGAPIGAYEFIRWGVCMPCTKKRASCVAHGGRCVCGRRQGNVIGSTECKAYGRTWRACRRCLGLFGQRG